MPDYPHPPRGFIETRARLLLGLLVLSVVVGNTVLFILASRRPGKNELVYRDAKEAARVEYPGVIAVRLVTPDPVDRVLDYYNRVCHTGSGLPAFISVSSLTFPGGRRSFTAAHLGHAREGGLTADTFIWRSRGAEKFSLIHVSRAPGDSETSITLATVDVSPIKATPREEAPRAAVYPDARRGSGGHVNSITGHHYTTEDSFESVAAFFANEFSARTNQVAPGPLEAARERGPIIESDLTGVPLFVSLPTASRPSAAEKSFLYLSDGTAVSTHISRDVHGTETQFIVTEIRR